ncbi:hypothetical protein PPACK8108_LOCUS16324, partial [Phakopsora pachyrhizi]
LVLKDETNHTVDDPQNIANSICSASQRATKSVGIATPTYYGNLVATRAKKWDISDENGSTVSYSVMPRDLIPLATQATSYSLL